ncbi:MAG: hypothetical protein MUC88_13620 [Planctomycetes bacterium]|nr:hypothetical protein [Planctomycetota bacterium]
MALTQEPLGLCSTCNSSPVCLRRKGIRHPVLLCEEFDDSTEREEEQDQPAAVIEGEEDPPERVTGLCRNCRNRESCMFQDAPGGVWHCEEYC